MKLLKILLTADLSRALNTPHRSPLECIPSLRVTVWFASCTAHDRKDFVQLVRTAQRIVGSPLPDLDSRYTGHLREKASSIATDSARPAHRRCVPLPSGRRLRAVRTGTRGRWKSCGLHHPAAHAHRLRTETQVCTLHLASF